MIRAPDYILERQVRWARRRGLKTLVHCTNLLATQELIALNGVFDARDFIDVQSFI